VFRAFEGEGNQTCGINVRRAVFHSSAQFHRWVREVENQGRSAVLRDQKPRGQHHRRGGQSYLRIAPEAGTVEVGSITYGPAFATYAGRDGAMYSDDGNGVRSDTGAIEWKCRVTR